MRTRQLRRTCRKRGNRAASCRTDTGLLLVRLAVGSVLFAHGAQKLFGWFDGGGLGPTAEAMEGMGYTPGRLSALAAGLEETLGGASLALGLATPAGGATVAAGMACASAVHAPNGISVTKGGLEYPALLGTLAAAIGLGGAGCVSADHLLGHRLDRPRFTAMAYPAAALVAVALIRRRASVLRVRAWEEAAREENSQGEVVHGAGGRND